MNTKIADLFLRYHSMPLLVAGISLGYVPFVDLGRELMLLALFGFVLGSATVIIIVGYLLEKRDIRLLIMRLKGEGESSERSMFFQLTPISEKLLMLNQIAAEADAAQKRLIRVTKKIRRSETEGTCDDRAYLEFWSMREYLTSATQVHQHLRKHLQNQGVEDVPAIAKEHVEFGNS